MRSPEQILSALPLRVRLTLGYTGAMAVVLAIVCVFLFLHTKAGIDQGIDDALALRAHDVAAAANTGDAAALLRTPALPAGQIGDIAQVVDAAGRVVAATPSARRPLLSAGELRAAQRRRIVHDRGDEPARARRAGRRGAGASSSSAPTCPSASTRSTSSRARC